MKKILLTFFLMVATYAMAEEFTLETLHVPKECEIIKYDAFSHEFEPDVCAFAMVCQVERSQFGSGAIRINRVNKVLNVSFRDGNKKLTEAEFSMLLSSGAIDFCTRTIPVIISPVK